MSTDERDAPRGRPGQKALPNRGDFRPPPQSDLPRGEATEGEERGEEQGEHQTGAQEDGQEEGKTRLVS